MKIALAGLILIASNTVTLALKEQQCSRAADPAWCSAMQQKIKSETAEFRRGDYTAMRNRALCLWDGCDGAFERDPEASCVLRREIVRRHSRKFDGNDEMHLANCTRRGM